MATPSPLHSAYTDLEAMFIPYGEMQIAGQIETVELEYAAIRKSVALLDSPHRGLLRFTGKDRLDFLHRMTTNDCRSMQPGDVRRTFLLNAKGRIIADLLAIHQADQTLVDTDVHDANAVAEELEKMLFSEDVKIENLTESYHRISLHGPRAAEASAWWKQREHGHAALYDFRYDESGEVGLHLWGPAEIMAAWSQPDEQLEEQLQLHHIGWLAYNIARIEAGRPLFHVDFGPDSLPHETGLLKETVSFTKGCYRGQEIVARMEHLGHPAKLLVGFRAEGDAEPVAGTPVYDSREVEAKVVGAVTSSTFSPMNSQAPVGLAMVKWGKHTAGSKLFTPAGGQSVGIEVVELPFYRRENR